MSAGGRVDVFGRRVVRREKDVRRGAWRVWSSIGRRNRGGLNKSSARAQGARFGQAYKPEGGQVLPHPAKGLFRDENELVPKRAPLVCEIHRGCEAFLV